MTGTTHTLIGATIAVALKEPLVVAPAALLSHFIGDALPHFGNHPKLIPYSRAFLVYLSAEALLCIIALGFAIALSPSDWFVISLGAAFATLPDFLWPFVTRSPSWAQPFYRFHTRIQWAERSYGWLYEIGYITVLIWAIIALTQ
jgi:hypothetical protein